LVEEVFQENSARSVGTEVCHSIRNLMHFCRNAYQGCVQCSSVFTQNLWALRMSNVICLGSRNHFTKCVRMSMKEVC